MIYTSELTLDYDLLEAIINYSNLLAKRAEEYKESLENNVLIAIENVTGPASGNLMSASDSIRDKIKALKQKSDNFIISQSKF